MCVCVCVCARARVCMHAGGWMDGWVGGWMGEWMDVCICMYVCMCSLLAEERIYKFETNLTCTFPVTSKRS
jgi:hypothetical protein